MKLHGRQRPRSREILRACVAGLVVCAMACFVAGTTAVAGNLYWFESGNLERADLDGASRTVLLSGLAAPRALAVDPQLDKIFWSGETFGSRIFQAHLDGTAMTVYHNGPLGDVRGIALDNEAGKVYWGELIPDKITRADLNGANQQTIVSSGLSSPYSMKFDTGANLLYWVDTDTGKLSRSNPDGSGRVDLATGLSRPTGLALDLDHGYIFATNTGIGSIVRMDLDGTNHQTILSMPLGEAAFIEVDPTTSKMYWTDPLSRTIRRANFDGSSMEILVADVAPGGFAIVVPEPSALALAGLGAVAWWGYARRARRRKI